MERMDLHLFTVFDSFVLLAQGDGKPKVLVLLFSDPPQFLVLFLAVPLGPSELFGFRPELVFKKKYKKK